MVVVPGMSQTPPELLRELEIEGYTAVMRAIYAGTYDWVSLAALKYAICSLDGACELVSLFARLGFVVGGCTCSEGQPS